MVPGAVGWSRWNSVVDSRRIRNQARDRRSVLAAMPSMVSWQPAATTVEVIQSVRLPKRTVLHLLHELNVTGLADEAGGRWRRRGDVPTVAEL